MDTTTPPVQQPESPEAPKSPELPKSLELPEAPQSPESPKSPESSHYNHLCGDLLVGKLPAAQPESPKSPKSPESPEAPQSPESPEAPQSPDSSHYNHPCGDLLVVGRDYITTAVPLYRASIAGDWDELAGLIEHKDHLLRSSITKNKETALHIAAMGQSTGFVEQLVNRMSVEDMALRNGDGNTPLCLAAISGNVEIAIIILEKNPSMLTTPGFKKNPLYLAALQVNHDMVTYLYKESYQRSRESDWKDSDWYNLFLKCVEADFFDVALQILSNHGESVVTRQNKRCVRRVLLEFAQKPKAFNEIHEHPVKKILNSVVGVNVQKSEATHLLKFFLERIVIDHGYDIEGILGARILFVAAETGNAKFLVELFNLCPDLMWKTNNEYHTIFHIAIMHRHRSIFNLLYEIGSMKDMVTRYMDYDKNNMLHIAGRLGSPKSLEEFPGAAYQMQQEVLWFKQVEAMVNPSYKTMKNYYHETPLEVFTKEHRALAAEGEAWIKSTINQSMVAAALISTIGFSVAFSIPGGYNQSNGFPMFHQNKLFMAYVILDALSFILSSISILMFLSILTSRYAQDDFLESLPNKLLLGQATLFLSIFTVMAAFSVSFFVTYHNNLAIMINILTTIPVVLFARQQYPLLIKAFQLVYGANYPFKLKIPMLYYQNPRF